MVCINYKEEHKNHTTHTLPLRDMLPLALQRVKWICGHIHGSDAIPRHDVMPVNSPSQWSASVFPLLILLPPRQKDPNTEDPILAPLLEIRARNCPCIQWRSGHGTVPVYNGDQGMESSLCTMAAGSSCAQRQQSELKGRALDTCLVSSASMNSMRLFMRRPSRLWTLKKETNRDHK